MNLGTISTMECRTRELTFVFLHDSHGGEVNDKKSYLQKMLMLTFDGGLCRDFITIFWKSQYLQCPIHVWNKTNGWIMMIIGSNYDNQILNIIYGNNHFEHGFMWTRYK